MQHIVLRLSAQPSIIGSYFVRLHYIVDSFYISWNWKYILNGKSVSLCSSVFVLYMLNLCPCFRSRLADFQQNCQPSTLSTSGCIRESRAMCLKAYAGLIGEKESVKSSLGLCKQSTREVPVWGLSRHFLIKKILLVAL